MTICLKQILFHQEQLKSNLKELFSHFGKYVKQYTNIFAEVGGLIGTVTADKNGLMPSTGFIHRSGVQIPTGGTISDIMTSDIKDGIYQVSGVSAADPMKDWGVLSIFGSKFAIFKPLNLKNYLIIFTRPTTTSAWDIPYKFTGVL